MKKGHPLSLLSPETDGKLVRKPSNNIPKSILMIDDPVIDTPSSLEILLTRIRIDQILWIRITASTSENELFSQSRSGPVWTYPAQHVDITNDRINGVIGGDN